MTPDDQDPSHTVLPPAEQDVADAAEIPFAENDEETEPDVDEEVDEAAANAVDGYLKMQKEIRSWGQWLLLFGVLHFIGSSILSAPWGVLLLIVGASSFYFREPAMFVIYAVTLAWAAVSNMLSTEVTWLVFGLFQIVLAVNVYRNFTRFRLVQSDYRKLVEEGRIIDKPAPDRAAALFPVTGCLLSAFALLGVVALVVVVFGAIIMETELSGAVDFFIGLVVNIAVLGLAVGLATIVAHYRQRVLAILGVIASVIVLLTWVAVNVLIKFAG